MSAVITRVHKARKEYKCDGYHDPDTYEHCTEPIRPGDQYVVIANPPWNDYEGDVDDEGRSIAWLREPDERQWYVQRRHVDCYIDWY